MQVPTPSRQFPALERTERYGKDKRSIIAWIGTALGGVAITAVAFAHGKLWSHETDIAVLKSETVIIKESLREQATLLREILNRIPRSP